ncbi:MAG: phosphatase PAP2 family protein [bacterium]
MISRAPLAWLLGLAAIGAVPVARAGDTVRRTGDVLHYALPAAALAVAWDHRDGTGAKEFAEAAVVTVGVTHALKHLVDETRPDGGTQSFPSGHASFTAVAAEFLRERYGWKYGGPAYAVAAFVAYSRVESKKHYTHDVLAGDAIGIGAAAVFTRPYRSAQVGVAYGAEFRGVCASWTF